MVSDTSLGMRAQTQPFNEYYLVSYLAKEHESSEESLAKNHFTECFGDTDRPAGRNNKPVFTDYSGYEMMSDGNWFMTSFAVQFPWLTTKGMEENTWYRDHLFPDWAQADRQWFADQTQLDWAGFGTSWGADPTGRLFGTGAGDSPSSYYVEKMGQDNHYIASAANMAGFMGASGQQSQISQDLEWLYDNGISYTKVRISPRGMNG